jgi:hypothetical protein
VLAGFLLFAGLGSACSGYVERLAGARRRSPLVLVVSAIVAIALVYLLLLPFVFDRFAGLPDVLRIAMSLALIAPLAFFMGMPFPLGLSRVAGSSPAFIPWAWGINGFASVVSASMATLLAIEFGFAAVVVLAMLLYGLAAVVFRAWPADSAQRA